MAALGLDMDEAEDGGAGADGATGSPFGEAAAAVALGLE